MTPDQQRWLRRARELAADVQRSFAALQPNRNLVLALIKHVGTLLDTPEWHGETLDAFLRDMLPLADCCASLEARLPVDQPGNPQLAWKLLLLADQVGSLSKVMQLALDATYESGGTPPPDLINRLALSASVPVRWCPKALRAAAERAVGQATQQTAMAARHVMPTCRPDLLSMAAQCALTTSAVADLANFDGPHIAVLRATPCTPATLASALGNLAAVFALFARFPATFKDQAVPWETLALCAAALLSVPENAAVVAAVEADADVQQQLAAALLPYAAHLLRVADLKSASWLKAWGLLVRTLAARALWSSQDAAVTAQRSAALAKGLLRLLRALPPPGKPPQPYEHAWEWIPIPLYTAKAAVVAAMRALNSADRVPRAQLQQVATLRGVRQQCLSTVLALLPITVDLLAAAAGQLEATAAGAGGQAEWRDAALVAAYNAALEQLLLYLMPAALDLLDPEESNAEEQRPVAQPGELAAAAEAALRFAAHAAVLELPSARRVIKEDYGIMLGMGVAERLSSHLVPAARQEATAAPGPGGVRPSLEAQLCFMHTLCKFVRVALAPRSAISRGVELSAEGLVQYAGKMLEISNVLLFNHVYCGEVPQGCEPLAAEGRAPLTPAEKRALVGSALTLWAASSAMVDLLPEGPTRETCLISVFLQLCRFLVVEDLASALLAHHAELAQQLLKGLMAATVTCQQGFHHPHVDQSVDSLDVCFVGVSGAVNGNRRLGPMLLGGAAGEALEAVLSQCLQGSGQELLQGRELLRNLFAMFATAAGDSFEGSVQAAAARLQLSLQSPAGMPAELPQEGWEALRVVRAAADEWLAQEAQQQWRQEQLLLCAEAAATRACSNLACTNLGGASEAGLKAKRCSGCRCARYCSTTCQREDWGAGHKAVCKLLQARQAAGE